MAVLAVAILPASISTAQQPQQAKFEAASIKPGKPPSDLRLGESSTSGGGPGGQFRMVNVPLKQWVMMALSVQDYALKTPSWLDTSRFDLNARMPGAPAGQHAKAEMMRSLLIERFGLKWHEELQTMSGFELVTDKKVLAQPASMLERTLGQHGQSFGPSSIQDTNISMAEFAELLADALGKPVNDATHLSGGYDIKLMWRPDNDAAAAQQRQYGKQYGVDVDNLPASVSTAIQEQLGLRLQSAKVPSRIIIVDQINRQPTEN